MDLEITRRTLFQLERNLRALTEKTMTTTPTILERRGPGDMHRRHARGRPEAVYSLTRSIVPGPHALQNVGDPFNTVVEAFWRRAELLARVQRASSAISGLAR